MPVVDAALFWCVAMPRPQKHQCLRPLAIISLLLCSARGGHDPMWPRPSAYTREFRETRVCWH